MIAVRKVHTAALLGIRSIQGLRVSKALASSLLQDFRPPIIIPPVPKAKPLSLRKVITAALLSLGAPIIEPPIIVPPRFRVSKAFASALLWKKPAKPPKRRTNAQIAADLQKLAQELIS